MFRMAMIAALTLASAGVEAQTIKGGGLNGQVLTAGVAVPANSSATVFTTPASGFFILTQVCSGFASCIGNLTVAGLGSIPAADNNGGSCQSFAPGLALPQNTAVSCANRCTSQGATCLITGVVTKK
jgi:hypothetical protein